MGVKPGELAIWETETNGLEWLEITIGDLLDQQTSAFAGQEALIYNYPEIGLNIRWNYQQLRDEVNRVARGLLALGIEKGEHVAIWGPNLPQWNLLHLALAKIGAVLVTVNPTYRALEVEYVLRQAEVTSLFMVEELRGNSFLEIIYRLAPELNQISDPAIKSLNSASLPNLKHVGLFSSTPRPGLLSFEQLVALGETISAEELQTRQASVMPDDTALIMYTSGTTGFPKGAMLTQASLINASQTAAFHLKLTPQDRYLCPMPLFHIAAITSLFLPSMLTGCTFVSMIGFDPLKQLQLTETEKATLSGGVPTMLIALLNHPRFAEFDLSSLRLMICGAAAVPIVLMEQVRDRIGADCGIVLGQTENSGLVSQTRLTDSFELKSGTIGTPQEFTEAKVVNVQTGEPVKFGEVGELVTRGKLMMQGYYKMPEKTAETIDAEGWLHTGDLASMGPQGHLNIAGRVKEMVIRGGENLYPVEIEGFLMAHPKLADAQLIGVPDAIMGEELVALLKLKPGESATEEEIRLFCRANMSHQKVPKYIKFVTEYPLTASGKVKKFELREALIKELGLEEVSKIKTA